MGERRMHLFQQFCLGAVLLVVTGGAGAGNGNFEQTVGSALADMAQVNADLAGSERAPPRRGKQAVSCELCEPALPLALRDDNRLDQRLRSQYRQMGESLAARLWDDPKGRRVKFDIEGKPGIGLEIPFD